ncbi:MAG: hypothetical protein OEY22_07065 [Candidatus Bathyarchaeota archaeon]|nr:hypothetical protein [Candidatus Bathyarchaeota archaeon]MDH5786744.1 hypothetical protein [Candidatus Bathyarchaeota archaeon]
MFDERKRTILLGFAFLLLLLLSSFENTIFFRMSLDVLQNLRESLQNQLLAVGILFIHNILVISLILIGMSFYVNLVVLDFFKREKYAHIVLEHPRTFALVFAFVIILLSILRGSTLIYGGITVEALPIILLISAPVGIVEGYGIYFIIKKTLSRTISMRDLVYIYGIFFIAAIMEVGFINLLIYVSA